MSEDLVLCAKVIEERSPDELHRLLSKSLLLVLVVKSSKEPSIKSHLSEKSRAGIRMTEWIDVPCNLWLYTEFLNQKLMTFEHVVNKVFVMRTGFI
jgi:hypothetical protein